MFCAGYRPILCLNTQKKVVFVQGTERISQAADYPRSNPSHVAELSANLVPNSSVHTRNYTTWCYNDEDIQELTVRSEPAAEGENATVPTWLPWLLTIGSLLFTHACSCLAHRSLQSHMLAICICTVAALYVREG